MWAPSSNGKVTGSSSRCTSRLPFWVIKTFFSPFMSKHDKTQQLAPKKLDIFIVLPSPPNVFTCCLRWASRNQGWGKRSVLPLFFFFNYYYIFFFSSFDLIFILQAPAWSWAGSLHIFKGGSWADVITGSLYKSEPGLSQKICSSRSSCEPHNVIVLLICGSLDNMTVPR